MAWFSKNQEDSPSTMRSSIQSSDETRHRVFLDGGSESALVSNDPPQVSRSNSYHLNEFIEKLTSDTPLEYDTLITKLQRGHSVAVPPGDDTIEIEQEDHWLQRSIRSQTLKDASNREQMMM